MEHIGYLIAALSMVVSLAVLYGELRTPRRNDLRERLRARLDLTCSRIVLPRYDANDRSGDFSVERFLATVRRLVGDDLPMTRVDLSGRVAGADQHRDLSIDPQRRRFVVRDLGADDDRPADQVDSKMLIATTKQLLRAAGESDPDGHAIEVMTLRGAAAHTRKVSVQRLVAGRPVFGDRLVLTFSRSGQFRKMLGQWRRLDLPSSWLRSPLTEQDVIEEALDSLVESGIEPEPDTRIVLETIYRPEVLSEDAYALRLEGRAELRRRGMHAGRTIAFRLSPAGDIPLPAAA